MRTAVIGIMTAAALTAASPAWAGEEVTCLWDKLPTAKRVYRIAGVRHLLLAEPSATVDPALEFTDSELTAAAAACRLPSEKVPRDVADAYAIELGMGDWLSRRYALRPGRLEAVWLELAVDYWKGTRLEDQNARATALDAVITRFQAGLGGPPPNAGASQELSRKVIWYWMTARYLRALIEGG